MINISKITASMKRHEEMMNKISSNLIHPSVISSMKRHEEMMNKIKYM